ncbi:MAG: helix-turn-helix transcriptional regulator [Chloroflexi bacterium]|nr:helix-turn-helix transcriptional regulator [Chloroflexota bacterium]
MNRTRPADERPGGTGFPDDFPQRLEGLRAASGLTWRALARELDVSVRSLYRWRAGTRPDAAHMLAILEFATDRNLLGSLLSRRDQGAADERQALLFADDVWARLGGERVERGAGHGEPRRAA